MEQMHRQNVRVAINYESEASLGSISFEIKLACELERIWITLDLGHDT